VGKLDQTRVRMEPLVFSLASQFDSASGHRRDIQQVQAYYLKLIDDADSLPDNPERARLKFSRQLLKLSSKWHGISFEKVSAGIAKVLIGPPSFITESDIQSLYQLSIPDSLHSFRESLHAYIQQQKLDEYQARSIIFSASDDLQREVINYLSKTGQLAPFLEISPSFRIRTREVAPEILGDFDPGVSPADRREFWKLFRDANAHVRWLHCDIPDDWTESKMDKSAFADNFTRERFKSFFHALRNRFVEMAKNKEKAAKILDSLSDYELLKRLYRNYLETQR
jgi:hypothetical protein